MISQCVIFFVWREIRSASSSVKQLTQIASSLSQFWSKVLTVLAILIFLNAQTGDKRFYNLDKLLLKCLDSNLYPIE